MRHWDLVDWVFFAFIGAISLAVFAFVAWGLYEEYNEYRAQPATIACEQRQMAPRRLYLTDSVICVPIPLRRDTLSVERVP